MNYTGFLAVAALAASLVSAGAASAEPLKLFVAPDGKDTWSGRVAAPGKGDGPFATLERARDEIRKARKEGGLPPGGAVVELAPGVYELAQPLALTAEDSGTETAPILYRARPGTEVRLVGGKQVTHFKAVADAAVLQRLDETARAQVLQADLKALGVTDLGEVVAAGQRLELFFQDRPMTLSRWPNEGFVRIVDVIGGAPHKIHGIPGDKIGKFTYDGDRPKRWSTEKDVWLHGYWFWDWADERQRVESIDTERRVVTLKPPYHTYGYRKNQWYYALNLLSELDAPGEYYLDRDTSTLYFWPPAPIDQGKALVSVLPALITTSETSHVTFRGMVLEATRNTPVVVSGGTEMRVVGCTIRNTGGAAVSMNGGTKHGVVGCDIYETAGGGISLSGGDRKTLTPCGHYADNNHVHHYARWDRVYKPGISLNGVGCRASHNLIHNAPHMAMGFGGNDHLIELNEIHSACYESNDAGAIYTGRNWSMRGTVIRHNYLHHIQGFEGKGCVGVYLDDQFSGTQIYGNVFYKVTRAAMIGGGRDCTIENNVFVECVPSAHVDARGLNWAARGFEGMKAGLEAMPYKSDLWAKRYPGIATTLDDEPMAPKGNLVARNICVGGKWDAFEGKAKPFITFQDNMLEGDPLFVDAEHQNFQLRDDSPALKLGFRRIPVRLIGLVDDDTRASWPVVHEVRPMVAPPPPPARAARKGVPAIHKVARVKGPVAIDGSIAPKEWAGANPKQAMVIEQGIQGEKVSPGSLAWLAHDGKALMVAIENTVEVKFPIRPGNQWGQDDAVELALRNPAAGKDAPILVLRGFPSGHFESSDEAGAPAAASKRAAEGVLYKAKSAAPGRWTCEWRIPFASLGIDPAKHAKLEFNISVRKTAGDAWVEWQGTGGSTWEVERAGVIELTR